MMETELVSQMPWLLGAAIVTIAAFFAGFLNAIAGGGSFLTFPALVFVGVPGIAANASSALAVLPGYMGGAAGFRSELAGYSQSILVKYCLIAMAGSVIGASLLIVTPSRLFDFIVPVLLLAATLLFAFHKKLLVYLKFNQAKSGGDKPIINPFFGVFLVAIYGGYFNGGLGIILLAFFTLIGMNDIHIMNGLKSLLSFVLSLVSVTTFVIAGLIYWEYALFMMAAASAGGYYGAMMSKSLSRETVRLLVSIIGFGMTAYFIWRLLP